MKEVEVLIEGGKATPAPPIGTTLAPMGINVGKVVEDMNKETKEFEGMKVPVKVIINDDKSYKITVGTPPVSALIKKELKLEKGSEKPGEEEVADMKIEQAIKVAKMKKDSILANNRKSAVKQVIGSCVSMGILVEGKNAKEAMKDVEKGKYDQKIKEGKTELSKEEKKKLEKEKKKLAEEIEKKREEEARIEAEEEAKKLAKAKEEGKEIPAEGEVPEEGGEVKTAPGEGEEEKPKEDEKPEEAEKKEPAKT